MAEFVQVWAQALPTIREGVTGVGVWAALNAARPVALEGGFFVLGLSSRDTELAGHLKMAQIKKLVETEMSKRLGTPVHLRVIDGTAGDDWERTKRRDLESQRLQDVAHQRMKQEILARTNWDSVYETLSRRYAAITNKSIPMNRARFYEEAVAILAESRRNQEDHSDLSERNFARCLERVGQYCDVPVTIVAHNVLKLAGEL